MIPFLCKYNRIVSVYNIKCFCLFIYLGYLYNLETFIFIKIKIKLNEKFKIISKKNGFSIIQVII